MDRVVVPWAPPSVFQARLWAKDCRNISSAVPLLMLSAIWLWLFIWVSSLCAFFSYLLVGYFFGYFSLIIFLLVLCFCPMWLPCFLGFPFHLQIFSWTMFHPLQLFLFATFTGDSAFFPCVGSVNVFVLGRHWFPSRWCLVTFVDKFKCSQLCVLCLVLMRGDEDATRKGVVRLHQSCQRM